MKNAVPLTPALSPNGGEGDGDVASPDTARNRMLDRIVELSGPMPNAVTHRRYLRGLSEVDMAARLKQLELERLAERQQQLL